MAPDRFARGPAPGAIGWALTPIYAAAVARRNRRFDAGRDVYRPPIPVISVGNISVGGVGKTPMVRRVARTLLDAGRRPAIVMRGYRARPGEPSDEEAEHRDALPDVPVLADPDRARSIRKLCAEKNDSILADCVVLDDGFQHRRVARSLDIVLIDARRDPWEGRLLPAGWLREPTASLARADAVVLTHAQQVDESRLQRLHSLTERDHGKPPAALAEHRWSALRVRDAAGVERDEPVRWLAGRRVIATCAIADPQRFLNELRVAGAEIARPVILRDHARYRPDVIKRLRRAARDARAETILCTGKDWPKLSEAISADPPGALAAPRLEMTFVAGEATIDRMILEAARNQPQR